MPVMPRPKGKSQKIAYDILGKPANMRHKKRTKREQEIYDRIRRDAYTRDR